MSMSSHPYPPNRLQGAYTHDERLLVLRSLDEETLSSFLRRKFKSQDVEWLKTALVDGYFSLSSELIPNGNPQTRAQPPSQHSLASPIRLLDGKSLNACVAGLIDSNQLVAVPVLKVAGHDATQLTVRQLEVSDPMRAFMKELVSNLIADHLSVKEMDLSLDQFTRYQAAVPIAAAQLLAASFAIDDRASALKLMDSFPGSQHREISGDFTAVCYSGKTFRVLPWVAAFQFGSKDCVELIESLRWTDEPRYEPKYFARIDMTGRVGSVDIAHEREEDLAFGLCELLTLKRLSIYPELLGAMLRGIKKADGSYENTFEGSTGISNSAFMTGHGASSRADFYDSDNNAFCMRVLNDRAMANLIPALIEEGFYTRANKGLSESLAAGHMEVLRAFADQPAQLSWDDVKNGYLGVDAPLNAVIRAARSKPANIAHWENMAVEIVDMYQERGVLKSALLISPVADVARPIESIVMSDMEHVVARLLDHGIPPDLELEFDENLTQYAESVSKHKIAAMLRSASARMMIAGISDSAELEPLAPLGMKP